MFWDEQRLNEIICAVLHELSCFVRRLARIYGVEIQIKWWNAQCPEGCDLPHVYCDDNNVPTIYARP